MSGNVTAVVIVLVQTATGAFWWRLARGGSARPLDVLGMGLALGTAAATLSGVLLHSVAPAGWGWFAPTLLTVIAAPFVLLRRRELLTSWHSTAWSPALLALGVGGLAGLASFVVNLRNYPLISDAVITSYHPDMLFFEAVSTSLARLGPSDSIFMTGTDLRYHWFAYAWAGQVAESADTEPFFVLTRLLPVVALLGTLLIAVSWTQRLTRGRWAPTVAVVLIVVGGYVGATYGTILNFDSPSQSFVTVWMLALCVALTTVLRRIGRWPSVLLLACVGLLSVSTTGGKVNSAAVVVAGWGTVALVSALRRDPWARRAWVSLAVLLAGVVAVYVAYLAGSAESGGLGVGTLQNKASSVQGLNPVDSAWGIILGTVALVLALVPRWAGIAWLVASPISRWRPLTMLSLGLAASGILAVLAFSGGLNETWFALSASAPLSVASAVGASRAVRSTIKGTQSRSLRPIGIAITVGALLSGGVVVLWTHGPDDTPNLRWLAPMLALVGACATGWVIAERVHSKRRLRETALALTVVTLITMASFGRVLSLGSSGFAVPAGSAFSSTEFRPFEPFTKAIDQRPVTTWSPGQRAAADWLRTTAGNTDLVATNIAFSPLVPALARTPMYIAAIQYQAPYGRPGQIDELLRRERATWAFIDQPSPSTAATLCAAGVDWIWVDPTRTATREWSPYAEIVRSEEDVILLALVPSAC